MCLAGSLREKVFLEKVVWFPRKTAVAASGDPSPCLVPLPAKRRGSAGLPVASGHMHSVGFAWGTRTGVVNGVGQLKENSLVSTMRDSVCAHV